MIGGASLQSLLSEKRFDLVETVFQEALADPLVHEDTVLGALRGLARAGQKPRVQALAGAADAALKKLAADPAAAKLRWTILKEAVRAGATPSTPDGFHRLFEEVLAAAWPGAASLTSLLGRFKFREAKDPAEGLAVEELGQEAQGLRHPRHVLGEVGAWVDEEGKGAGLAHGLSSGVGPGSPGV